MQIAFGLIGKALEEFPRQAEPEGAGHVLRLIEVGDASLAQGIQSFPHQIRTAAEIDDAARKAFVHRDIGFASEGVFRVETGAVAAETPFIAQGLEKGLAQGDATIFNSMMGIDFQVAFALEFEVADGVLGEKREHVIQERDARLDTRFASAIDGQFQLDGGFFGDTLEVRAPDRHGTS